jgi:hypothetical protein
MAADDGGVAARRSREDDAWWIEADASAGAPGRVQTGALEYQPEPYWWQSRWRSLPRAVRRLVVVVVVLGLATAGGVELRDRMVARELGQRVVLSTSLGVWTSSTSRPYGYVSYFVAIRNGGTQPLSVTDVELSTEQLRLRMRSDAPRRVEAGQEIQVLVSVRLTCSTARPSSALPAQVSVRRDDGSGATRDVDLQPSALILDAANTLCAVRPGLTDHEISGPITLTAQGDGEGN